MATAKSPPGSWELKDDDGRITKFDGVQLATATSDNGQALRWTEVALYRTIGGAYVIHKIGRTVAYHVRDATSCKSHGSETEVSVALKDCRTLIICPVCSPRDLEDYAPSAKVRVEADRSTVLIAASPGDAVAACYTDIQGQRYLTKTASRALKAAADLDDSLRLAWMVQVVK